MPMLAAVAIAAASLTAVHEVTIENFAFTPDALTIRVGDTVRWTNLDFIGHDVTSQTGPGTLVPSGVFTSPLLDYGQVFEFTFTSPAQYAYYCRPHGSSMQASVTIVPPPCPADLNGDDRVNTLDLTTFLGAFGRTGPNLPGDYDRNNAVDTADLVVLLGQFGCNGNP